MPKLKELDYEISTYFKANYKENKIISFTKYEFDKELKTSEDISTLEQLQK
jgi:hypothetical protein